VALLLKTKPERHQAGVTAVSGWATTYVRTSSRSSRGKANSLSKNDGLVEAIGVGKLCFPIVKLASLCRWMATLSPS